jgi:hypothetical protein
VKQTLQDGRVHLGPDHGSPEGPKRNGIGDGRGEGDPITQSGGKLLKDSFQHPEEGGSPVAL